MELSVRVPVCDYSLSISKRWSQLKAKVVEPVMRGHQSCQDVTIDFFLHNHFVDLYGNVPWMWGHLSCRDTSIGVIRSC